MARRYPLSMTMFEADPNDVGSLLRQAVGAHRMDEVTRLVDTGADVNAFVNHQTPLGIAVGLNNLDMIDHLLDLGADIDAPRTPGAPALLATALESSRAPVVVQLLERGAQAVPQNHGPNVPVQDLWLTVAIRRGHTTVVRALLSAMQRQNVVLSDQQWQGVIVETAQKAKHEWLRLFKPFSPTLPDEKGMAKIFEYCPRYHQKRVRSALDELHRCAEQRILTTVANDILDDRTVSPTAFRPRL